MDVQSVIINFLRKQKRALIIAAVILVYYVAVLIGLSPRVFPICDEQKIYSYYESCPQYDILSYCFWQVIGFLDKHAGSLTAAATFAIFFATKTMADSTRKLWETTRDQLKLANREFLATHRPRIVVTAFDAKMMLDKSIEISFIFINAGESVALVNGAYWGVGISDQPHGASEMGGGESYALKQMELTPGQQHTVETKYRVNNDAKRLAFHMAMQGSGNQKIFLRGRVTYQSTSGTQMQMGFYRVYDPIGSRWLKVSDSDYEYSF